jgi:hypothetical protein
VRRLTPWLLLCGVVLAAMQPLLGGVPHAADALLHYHRLGQLGRALHHSILYPRWLPDMGYGYGFPLFNYYAPLSYYLAQPLRLLGVGTEDALLAMFAFGLLVAFFGAFVWARDLFGPLPGLVAGAAYAYAPYLLYNVYRRGALAEVWGLAVLPFVFLAIRRLAIRPDRRRFFFAVLSYTALVLTHNILALVCTPLLLLYSTVLCAILGGWRRRALALFGSLFWGLAASAFFWMPALLEQQYVQIHQLYAPEGFNYSSNFTTVAQLLAPPRSVDPTLINQSLPRSFGWPQLALALLAFLHLRRAGDSQSRSQLAFLGLVLVVLTFMMLPLSEPAWDRLPLLRFVQFPWRFLGPAGLFLALLAGAGAAALIERQPLLAPIFVLLLVLFALTWLFPAYYPKHTEPTPLSLIAFETETGALGTTSAGDYLPIWVETLPAPDSLLTEYEQAGYDPVIPRLAAASLPPEARVEEAEYGLTTADVSIDSPVPFTAIFNWYYFPGWKGSIDEQPVELRPVGEHGLIGADIPAGRHSVSIRFGGTVLRFWASVTSALSVIAVPVAALIGRRSTDLHQKHRPGPVPTNALLACAGIGIAVFALKGAYLDQHDSPFRRSRFDGETVLGVQFPLQVGFDDQMALMGYDLPSSSVPADGSFELTLYWRAERALDADYSIAVHLVDSSGQRYGQKDSQHPGGQPTTRWSTDQYATDLHRLEVWPGTPPGEYLLRVGVYDLAAGRALDVLDASGNPVGTALDLATVQVTLPARMPDPSDLSVSMRHDMHMGGGLVLVGSDPPPAEIGAGQRLAVTLYWLADRPPAEDYSARLSLMAADATEVASEEGVLGTADHPTSSWISGEVLRETRSLQVPAALDGGDYEVSLVLLDSRGETVSPAVGLGRTAVIAPDRSFDIPQMEHQQLARFGEVAELLGYDLAPGPHTHETGVAITLYWRAMEGAGGHDYAVFAHLLGEDGRLVAQQDGAPAAWTRPTTSWVVGEVVADARLLTFREPYVGSCAIEVGLYDPQTAERVTTQAGQSFVLLDSAVVVGD